MTAFDSITALRIGQKILDEFKKEMKSVVFTFEDYEELQNDYEKIIFDLCNESFEKGKNDLSKKEFDEWLSHNCAYEDKKESSVKTDKRTCKKLH